MPSTFNWRCLFVSLPHVRRVEAAGKGLALWRENTLPRRIPTHMHVSGSGHQRVPLKHMLGCPLFLPNARWEATRQAYHSLSCRAGLSKAAMGPNVPAPLSRVMNTLRLPCPCPARGLPLPPAGQPTHTITCMKLKQPRASYARGTRYFRPRIWSNRRVGARPPTTALFTETSCHCHEGVERLRRRYRPQTGSVAS